MKLTIVLLLICMTCWFKSVFADSEPILDDNFILDSDSFIDVINKKSKKLAEELKSDSDNIELNKAFNRDLEQEKYFINETSKIGNAESDFVKAANKRKMEEMKLNPNGIIAITDELNKEYDDFQKIYKNSSLVKNLDDIFGNFIGKLNELSNGKCQKKRDSSLPLFDVILERAKKEEIIESLKECEILSNKFFCDSLIELSCKQKTTCLDDIKISTDTSKDIDVRFNENIITIAKTHDSNWDDGDKGCAVFDRKIKINIKEKNTLKHFIVKHVNFDDYLQIKVNGHIVFIGPDQGSTILDIVDLSDDECSEIGRSHRMCRYKKAAFNGIEKKSCERMKEWKFSPHIDITRFLVEGENLIETRVVIGNKGGMFMQLEVVKECCASWNEEIITKCEPRL